MGGIGLRWDGLELVVKRRAADWSVWCSMCAGGMCDYSWLGSSIGLGLVSGGRVGGWEVQEGGQGRLRKWAWELGGIGPWWDGLELAAQREWGGLELHGVQWVYERCVGNMRSWVLCS